MYRGWGHHHYWVVVYKLSHNSSMLRSFVYMSKGNFKTFPLVCQNDNTHLNYQVTIPNSKSSHEHFKGPIWVCRAQLHFLIWLCVVNHRAVEWTGGIPNLMNFFYQKKRKEINITWQYNENTKILLFTLKGKASSI